jgi:hypothetical protein
LIPDLTPRISQKPDPRDTRGLTLRIWAVLFPVLWIVHALLPLPLRRPLALWQEAALAALLALGVSLIAALIILTRHRGASAFRPLRPTLIGWAILTFVAPISLHQGLPMIFGGTAATFVGMALTNSGGPSIFAMLAISAVGTALISVITYPVASLLVAGIGNRWWRFAVFCLIWWSAWSAHVLIVNEGKFML